MEAPSRPCCLFAFVAVSTQASRVFVLMLGVISDDDIRFPLMCTRLYVCVCARMRSRTREHWSMSELVFFAVHEQTLETLPTGGVVLLCHLEKKLFSLKQRLSA